MIKSDVFEVGLLYRYHIYIPKRIMKPFVDAKVERLYIKASYNNKLIDFYAAFVRDKHTEDYRIMFGKRLQKELGVLQNDYFEIQIFENTSKYGVQMPEELQEVFKLYPEAFNIFETITVGKQRTIIYAIARYKTSQTKIDKALIVCENLRKGHLNPYTILKPH